MFRTLRFPIQVITNVIRQNNVQLKNRLLWLALVLAAPLACFTSTNANAATKVAFIADQGIGSGAVAVLSLIRDEGTDLLLIQGDLGYAAQSAAQWEENITKTLGRNFPVLSVVGNHENYEWPLYQRLISQRVERANGLSCSGEEGVKASCTFNNIQIVQVAQGVRQVSGVESDDNYADYIRDEFSNSSAPWRICSWHKNQRKMQAYSKSDETGWDIYDACLNAGAMVAMGHAHTYSRTHLLSDYENQTIAHTGDELVLESGRSFAIVSGLGGRDIKPQENDGPWFASIYTQTQNATHGALFCTLGNTTADCYFKAINGAVPDQFTLKTKLGSASTENEETPSIDIDTPDEDSALPPPPSVNSGYVFTRTDKNEHRWIEVNEAGELGSVWIGSDCMRQMGGITVSGDWRDLMALAPAFDSLESPCESEGENTNNTGQSQSGYVFSRTDKNELRWIDRDDFGVAGSVWIDQSCSDRLGGVKVSGNWDTLNEIAPGFDAIASPCY